jgi:ABC-type multidrug transport system fused ATPase/permease subunit
MERERAGRSPVVKPTAEYLPRIVRYVRPYWKFAVASGVLIVISAGLGLLAPWPLKILIDHAIQNQPLTGILRTVLGGVENRSALLLLAVLSGLGLTLIQNGLSVVGNYINTRPDQNIVLDFRSDLFQHAQRLSLAFHDQKRSGEVIYATNFQAGSIARIVMVVPPLAHSVLTLAGMFWISMRIDWQLATLSLSVVPFLYYSVSYYMTHIQTRVVEVKRMEVETLSLIHEAMTMIRVIAAFGREGHEHRRFRELGERATDARVKLTVRQTLFSLVVNTTTAAGTALVLGFGAYLVLNGRLTVGQLLVVMAYVGSVYKPLETISTTVGSVHEILLSLKIAFDLLDTDSQVKDFPGAVATHHVRGDIAFAMYTNASVRWMSSSRLEPSKTKITLSAYVKQATA